MDYEKYNNALEKAKVRYNEIKDTDCSEEKFLLDLFPELKESENERIRKEIIDFLWKEKIFLQEAHSSVENSPKYRFVMDAIAWLEKQKSVGEIVEKCKNSWYNEGKISGQFEGLTDDEKYQQGWHDALEKQGEQKAIMNVPTREVILAIWDLGNEWKELTNGCISTKYGTQLDYIQKHWQESEYYLREKQGEQKVSYTTLVETGNGGINALVTRELPTNSCDDSNYCSDCINKKGCINCENGDMKETEHKVEPKFHEGNWIIDKQGIVHQIEKVIENVTNNTFAYDLVGGGYFNEEVKSCRLWTIQDAKDGDVLSNGKMIVIFKHFEEPSYRQRIVAYIGLDNNGDIQITDDTWKLGIDKAKPATKEERNLLFSKMKEEGYEWDADKKELKKINSYCQENCKGYQETSKCFADGGCDAKRKAEQKSTTWSEDDEEFYNDIIKYFSDLDYSLSNDEDDVINWLKSLKERLS